VASKREEMIVMGCMMEMLRVAGLECEEMMVNDDELLGVKERPFIYNCWEIFMSKL
jgi:hypothetical protein